MLHAYIRDKSVFYIWIWGSLTVEFRIDDEREFDDTLDGCWMVVFDTSFSRA